MDMIHLHIKLMVNEQKYSQKNNIWREINHWVRKKNISEWINKKQNPRIKVPEH